VAKGIPVSHYDDAWAIIVARIVCGVGLLDGGAIAVLAHDVPLRALGIAIAVITGCGLVANEIVAARRRAAQRSVIDTGSGLRWLGGPDEATIDDAQVLAVRLKYTDKYASGILKAVIRRFEIWTAASETPLRMTNRINAGGSDPLDALIKRIIEGLKQRTAAGLAKGGSLEGEGWRLAATGLTVAKGRTEQSIPFAEIDKVGIFDGKWCIWQKGLDEPVAKLAPDSKNAPVLGSLLGEWIEHREKKAGKEPAEAPPGSMGRLLFERRSSGGLALGLLGAMIGGVVGTIFVFQRDLRPVGSLVLLGAGVAAVLGVLFGKYAFRCYERGLVRFRGRNELRMAYAEIVQFDYSATRMFHNGIYSGTSFSLAFRSPGATIRYSTHIKSADADLEELRDHIAKVIASRMFCQLREGKPVPWGSDVVFLPQGLQFRRPKMLGLSSGSGEILPYDQIRGTNMEQGVLYFFSKAAPKAVFSKQVASPNFFPGLFLLLTMQQGQANADRPAT
jgi:hypothetical protein